MSDEVRQLPELELVSAPEETNSSCFHKLEVSEHLSLLPCFVGRLSHGVTEHLNKKLLRYSDHYGGVLLAYSKPCVQQTYGRILDEQPHIHFDLKYIAYVFRPVIGSVVCGTVNNVGGDHVGCLVYDCFNASVFSGRGEGKTNKRTNGLFGGKFSIGSRIWFRVLSIENVSGILSIVGEYFDLDMTQFSQEEQSIVDNEDATSMVDVTVDIDDDSGQTSLTSPKKKKKDKLKKKKKKKKKGEEVDSLTEGSQSEREVAESSKKFKRKSNVSEDIQERSSSQEEVKVGKKRKTSVEPHGTPKKKKKRKDSLEQTPLSTSKRHKHKR